MFGLDLVLVLDTRRTVLVDRTAVDLDTVDRIVAVVAVSTAGRTAGSGSGCTAADRLARTRFHHQAVRSHRYLVFVHRRQALIQAYLHPYHPSYFPSFHRLQSDVHQSAFRRPLRWRVSVRQYRPPMRP